MRSASQVVPGGGRSSQLSRHGGSGGGLGGSNRSTFGRSHATHFCARSHDGRVRLGIALARMVSQPTHLGEVG